MPYPPCLFAQTVRFAIGSGVWAIASLPTQAQIIPDTTLPSNSQVAPGCQVCAIGGGTVRGANLFHSFREFSIPTGGSAQFNNAPQIQTILTRVTGPNASRIDGLIQANGTANLFLLNPNGITFGPNAALQIGGSFVASTTDRFQFPDGNEFSAVDPQAPPLLAINLTPGLQYGRGQAPIENNGNLAVNPGHSLMLLGSDVFQRGTLTAPGGTVQVLGDRVALLDQAQIDVSAPQGGGTVLIGGDFQGNGPVPTASRTFVGPKVSITADALDAGNGGKVIVWGNEATRFYGTVSAQGGDRGGNGGFVEISGRDFLAYQGQVNAIAPNGLPGTLLLDPTNITVIAGGNNPPELTANDQFADPGVNNTINNGTINNATANVILQATNTIVFDAPVNITTPGIGFSVEAGNSIILQGGPLAFLGFGNNIRTNGGNVSLRANADITIDNAAIRTNSAVGGDAGAIAIAAGRLILQNGGGLLAESFGAGQAGTITIQANEVNIATAPTSNLSGISASGYGTGNAGRIAVNTGRLVLSGGSQIQSASLGAGDAGAIAVQANQIELYGQSNSARVTGLFTLPEVNSSGRAGAITLDTQRLLVQDGAGIYAGTVTSGTGGTLTIRASEIDVNGIGSRPSLLSVGVLRGLNSTGNAGSMQITTDRLTVRNGAVITANAFGGQAGTVNIQANAIALLNGGELAAEGRQSGTINLNTARLQVSDASFLSAAALAGDGGDRLSIRATESVTVQNGSSISTTALTGQTGNLRIETPSLTLQNLSTVSASPIGTGIGGTVTVRSPDRTTSQIQINRASFLTGNSLSVETGTLTVDAGGISTAVIGQRQSGNIRVQAGNVTVQNSGYIATSVVGQGQGGTLAIAVDNALNLNNRGVISTATFGAGTGGTLTVSARQLNLSNQSTINTLSIDQLDSLTRSEIFNTPQFSAIQPSSPLISGINQLLTTAVATGTATGMQGNAGDLTVQVSDRITIANQSSLATAASGTTNGASLSVQTGDLTLLDQGALRSDINGQGRGGDIQIRANTLRSQSGLISSRGLNLGTAANITINLTNALTSNNGQILASSDRSGGGNISLTANDIRLRDSSLISTSVFDSTGGGGNITIRSQLFLALEDSDILANAEFGPGGNIFINSPVFLANLFGTGQAIAVGRNPGSFAQFRGNGRVDISADSRAGTSGTVIFPRVDPARGVTPLVVDLVDPTQQIDQRCLSRNNRASSFTTTGRGGLPTDPTQPLTDEAVLVDWIRVQGDQAATAAEQQATTKNRGNDAIAPAPTPPRIVEAQGWQQTPDGTVYLVAEAGYGESHLVGLPLVDCSPNNPNPPDER